jgi:hypothetical protein
VIEQNAFSVWWGAAGCLYDSDTPAYEADTMHEIILWLLSDDANGYRDCCGDNNTYAFDIVENATGEVVERCE